MRYILMHKASPQDEAGTPPPAALIQEMGRFIGDAIKAGVFLGGDGLHPTSRRMRLSCRGGEFHLQKGPYAGAHELPASFAAISVRTVDEAVLWAKSFALALSGDVDLEIGALVEEWDLGAPKPAGEVPLRFLVVQKADAATESGREPAAANRAALSKLLADAARSGTLLYHEVLQPSARGHRLHYRDNQLRVVDGPFSESKELIGGFCVMQLRDLDEMLPWANRYVRILGGTLEIDVRPIAEPAAGSR